ASFVKVDWSRAELGRVNFSDAQLKDVDFEYSNLSRARFNGAKLTDVNFLGAYTFLTRFENVDLSATSQLSQAQLDMACGNIYTQLPQGLERPASWPCDK
ncbi:MAG: pentapeptide repeat-containing protein, partial [Proteobacteria bacterium]|nr:pentapeptide repeat-containing protein [Pseudomonadota bacterium]